MVVGLIHQGWPLPVQDGVEEAQNVNGGGHVPVPNTRGQNSSWLECQDG